MLATLFLSAAATLLPEWSPSYFWMWNTKTTDFNSVKTAAGRDYVREFCEACRAEGIRVGLYFSLMNWPMRE